VTTLNTWFARAVAAHRDAPAVALGTAVLHTYGQLDARVRGLAGALHDACGGRQGERVVLVMQNTVQYVELLLATWHAGLCAVPVNAKLHPVEIDFILRNSGARLCVSHGERAHALAEVVQANDGVRLVDAGTSGYEAMVASPARDAHGAAEDDPAWLFYTSGTTGRPKGVMLTHANLIAMSMCFHCDVAAIDHRDTIVHVAPLSHGSGLYGIPHWMKGALQVIPESGGFDEDELFGLVAHFPNVNLFASPTIVRRMARRASESRPPLANLKTVIAGGAPFYVEDVRAAVATLGPTVAQIYGQGESPMTITAISAADIAAAVARGDDEMLASVGTPQSLVEVQVWDAGDRPVPAGETGEVVVRGPTVMKGYWNNPEATAKTLAGDWLRTGDVGCLTPRGLLVLKDRSKDVIITGGSNVYPREVEEVLLLHPAVAEAAVVGRPDPEWGEAICAFIVAKPGARATPEELDALCLERIARFKRPKVYIAVEQLPKNNTGKVLKTTLRELARSR
jgi:long-chain acyl-CoA synthetase